MVPLLKSVDACEWRPAVPVTGLGLTGRPGKT